MTIDEIREYEKGIPKKPLRPIVGGYGICPCCNNNLLTMTAFCDRCKQALDWSFSK